MPQSISYDEHQGNEVGSKLETKRFGFVLLCMLFLSHSGDGEGLDGIAAANDD